MEPKKEKIVELTPEEYQALDQGIKTAENGRRWTIEEAFDFVRKQRKTWKKTVRDNLSA